MVVEPKSSYCESLLSSIRDLFLQVKRTYLPQKRPILNVENYARNRKGTPKNTLTYLTASA